MRRVIFWLAVACGRGPRVGGPSGREVRCLALVAYTEAAVDGVPGMAAVIRVVRNRMADPRFPDDACAVIAAGGAVPADRAVGGAAEGRARSGGLQHPAGAGAAHARRRASCWRRRTGWRGRAPAGPDPTGGALYFVNPDYMNPDLCPWFAKLKRTAAIGGHVFMTDYRTARRPVRRRWTAPRPAIAAGEAQPSERAGARKAAPRRGRAPAARPAPCTSCGRRHRPRADRRGAGQARQLVEQVARGEVGRDQIRPAMGDQHAQRRHHGARGLQVVDRTGVALARWARCRSPSCPPGRRSAGGR